MSGRASNELPSVADVSLILVAPYYSASVVNMAIVEGKFRGFETNFMALELHLEYSASMQMANSGALSLSLLLAAMYIYYTCHSWM